MLESILKAIENFCTHQLRSSSKILDTKIPHDNLTATFIDVDKEDEKYRISFLMDNNFLQAVAKVFFDEDESDEETLKDVALECTNLIVGSAKVIALKEQNSFEIATPFIKKYEDIKEFDIIKVISCNDNEIYISVEKLK